MEEENVTEKLNGEGENHISLDHYTNMFDKPKIPDPPSSPPPSAPLCTEDLPPPDTPQACREANIK